MQKKKKKSVVFFLKERIFSFKQFQRQRKKILMPAAAVPNQKGYLFSQRMFIPQMWKNCTALTFLKNVFALSEIVFQSREKCPL